MANVAVWFEIPSRDFERAVAFYEKVFQLEMIRMNLGGDMAMFPADEGAANGAILAPQPDYETSKTGAVIYINGGDDIAPILTRVVPAGGKILVPKTQIPGGDMGYFAHFLDSEGNRIGVHSMQ